MARGARLLLGILLCLPLPAVAASPDSLLALGEELLPEPDEALGFSRWGMGLSSASEQPRGRLRGELHGWNLHFLADLSTTSAKREPGGAILFARRGWSLGAGAFSSSNLPALLSAPRKRSSPGALPGCRGPASRILARAAPFEEVFLGMRFGAAGIRLGEGPDGRFLDLRRGASLLSLRAAGGQSALILAHWKGEGVFRWQGEAGLAGGAEGRRMAIHCQGSLESGGWNLGWETRLLAGPRPQAWKSRGWIGAARGREARLALATPPGTLPLRLGLRAREGAGLAAGRSRREMSLDIPCRLDGRSLRIGLRGIEETREESTGSGLAQPRVQILREGSWESSLHWRGSPDLRMVFRRKVGEEGLLLRLEESGGLAGLDLRLRLWLHRASDGFGSFLLMEGGRLGRRVHSLRGRGWRLALDLSKKRGDWELRADLALSSSEPPAFSLELQRSFGRRGKNPWPDRAASP